MNAQARRIGMLLLFATLGGCAAPTAMSVIRATGAHDAVIPQATTIESELKGRAFELGDLQVGRLADAPNGTLDLRDEAYVHLLRRQLEKAFGVAHVGQGVRLPPFRVGAVIEVAKFTDGRFLLPDPSIFQVLLEINRPDGSLVMRGRFRTGELEAVPVVGGAVAIHRTGAALEAASTAIPAMALIITQVISGLRDGTGLDAIELNAWPAHVALAGNRLGLTRLQAAEIERLRLGLPGP